MVAHLQWIMRSNGEQKLKKKHGHFAEIAAVFADKKRARIRFLARWQNSAAYLSQRVTRGGFENPRFEINTHRNPSSRPQQCALFYVMQYTRSECAAPDKIWLSEPSVICWLLFAERAKHIKQQMRANLTRFFFNYWNSCY